MEEGEFSVGLIVRLYGGGGAREVKLNMWLRDDEICISSAYLCFCVTAAYMPSAM